MSYLERQREQQVCLRDELFSDPGRGEFKGKRREFVLENRTLNLFPDIRESATQYFRDKQIVWWDGGKKNEPSGHLLSSQIACLNHLFLLREEESCASDVVRDLDNRFSRAVELPDEKGFVAFEKTGARGLGRENSTTRGANATSIDALMLAERTDGGRTLVLVEWKYTELYGGENIRWAIRRNKQGEIVRKTDRLSNYRDLLEHSDCPLQWKELDDYFFEPYYQLMRQTLLGWKMIEGNDYEYRADDWLHVHVIPSGNLELRERVTSPGLRRVGSDLETTWRACLRDPARYQIVSPDRLLEPLQRSGAHGDWLKYLSRRYWRSAESPGATQFADFHEATREIDSLTIEGMFGDKARELVLSRDMMGQREYFLRCVDDWLEDDRQFGKEHVKRLIIVFLEIYAAAIRQSGQTAVDTLSTFMRGLPENPETECLSSYTEFLRSFVETKQLIHSFMHTPAQSDGDRKRMGSALTDTYSKGVEMISKILVPAISLLELGCGLEPDYARTLELTLWRKVRRFQELSQGKYDEIVTSIDRDLRNAGAHLDLRYVPERNVFRYKVKSGKRMQSRTITTEDFVLKKFPVVGWVTQGFIYSALLLIISRLDAAAFTDRLRKIAT